MYNLNDLLSQKCIGLMPMYRFAVYQLDTIIAWNEADDKMHPELKCLDAVALVDDSYNFSAKIEHAQETQKNLLEKIEWIAQRESKKLLRKSLLEDAYTDESVCGWYNNLLNEAGVPAEDNEFYFSILFTRLNEIVDKDPDIKDRLERFFWYTRKSSDISVEEVAKIFMDETGYGDRDKFFEDFEDEINFVKYHDEARASEYTDIEEFRLFN
jgi:hypothetical protein